MRTVRWLAWTVGILFLLGTALQLVDQLNLYATRPEPAGTLNMVEFRLLVQPYRVAIWPIFFLNNLSFGIAFVALAGLGIALASWLASGDPRRIAIATSLGVGGVLGAVAQLILIGATQATIDTAYCDCGFKETEIVSQVWAQMDTQDIGTWLNRFASLLLAGGLVVLVREAGTVIPAMLRTWTYVTAIALVVAPVLGIVQRTDPEVEELITLIVGLVLVPVWAVWLARSVDAGPSTSTAPAAA